MIRFKQLSGGLSRREFAKLTLTTSLLGLVAPSRAAGALNNTATLYETTKLSATPKKIRQMRFKPSDDFMTWQVQLREQLARKLVIPEEPYTHPLNVQIESQDETEEYTIDRITFTSEPGEVVPGYLLLPKNHKPPYPVMICLQGHSPGMHISIVRAKTERDQRSIDGGRDLALQAVAHGWAALAIEQRGFGERAEEGLACRVASMRTLHTHRPMTGSRVLDIMRTIDFIESQPNLDANKIASMGNSAGGTVTFYAACIDPRIRLAVVSCSFGPYANTWLADPPRCPCGYIPGIYTLADMPDLAGLIAPRQLLIVAGKEDHLAPIESVHNGVETAGIVYEAAGTPDHIQLVVGDGGHQFYPEISWPVIQNISKSWDSE